MEQLPLLLPDIILHHFSVSVPDLQAAMAWYHDILGFVEEQTFEIPALPARAAFMKRGALRLEIWQAGSGASVPAHRREPNSDLKEGGTKHIAFAVPRLQGCLDGLVSRGVDIAAVQRDPTSPMVYEPDPCDTSRGPAFAAFIRDPAGTLIELLDADRVGG